MAPSLTTKDPGFSICQPSSVLPSKSALQPGQRAGAVGPAAAGTGATAGTGVTAGAAVCPHPARVASRSAVAHEDGGFSEGDMRLDAHFLGLRVDERGVDAAVAGVTSEGHRDHPH